jgi:hypothetical protein
METSRIMPTNKLLIVICCLSLLLLCTCTQSVSGVETTNGYATVIATSTTIEGTAPPLSQVYMCDTGYIPFIDFGIGFITSTDFDGNFRFTRRPGSYHVSIFSPQGTTAGTVIESSTDNTTAFQNSLERPGSISGSVTHTAGDTLLVYLAGMSQYQLVTNGQSFSFTSIPGGNYRLRIIIVPEINELPAAVLFEKRVSVDPGEDVAIGVITVH